MNKFLLDNSEDTGTHRNDSLLDNWYSEANLYIIYILLRMAGMTALI
jgi:hypothetical protein